MKTLLLAVTLGCTFSIAGLAQVSGAAGGLVPDADERDAASASQGPETIDTDTRAPTRAERRALRRGQREAADEAELAAAAEEAARPADTNGAGDDDDEGIICRRESTVGTHRRIRICTTRAEREAMRESSREVIRDITRPGGDFGLEGIAAGRE